MRRSPPGFLAAASSSSTNGARQAGGSKGWPKYATSRQIFPSRMVRKSVGVPCVPRSDVLRYDARPCHWSDPPQVVLEHPHSPDPSRGAVPGLAWRASSGPWLRKPVRGDSARPSAGRDLCWPSRRGRHGAQPARRTDAPMRTALRPSDVEVRRRGRCGLKHRGPLRRPLHSLRRHSAESDSASLIPVSAGFAACSC